MRKPGEQCSIFNLVVLSLVTGSAGSAWAQGKTAPTDAQIESSVLRALASAPELSTQNIQTTSVYGTVTLSGNVHDEALRTRAENLVARAEGVKKVIDEMTLGDTPAVAAAGDPAAANMATGGQVLQSDGTYAAAPPSGAPETVPADPAAGQQGPAQAPYAGNSQGQGNQPYQGSQPYPNQPYQGNANQAGQPYQSYPPRYGQPSNGGQAPYSAGSNNAPYGPPDGQRPYGGVPGNGYGPGQSGQNGPNGRGDGQQAGIAVTVPGGASLQVRIDRGIDSNHIQPGTPFTGTVLSDVPAGGFVAIPRGASVQGTVVDAKRAGTFKGEGELALQITSVGLGGQSFPVNTLVWQREGRDKTLSTVNTALGLGALGAVFGGLAGGGAGAAIGAGVGGAVGVGASAASPGGRVIVPPESVLTFSLAQPLAVNTVSQGEMQRLSYAAGSGPGQRPVVVRRRYYGPYGPYASGPYGSGPYGYPYGANYYGR